MACSAPSGAKVSTASAVPKGQLLGRRLRSANHPTTGTLYAGNSSRRFFTIDPTSGAMADLGGGTGATDFKIEGLTFVPEPSTYAAIFGFVVLGAVVLRRRRD